MIVFDLRCGAGHVFEAWFAGSAAYEDQRAAGQVACPMCGDTEVSKAVMAPAVPAKGNRSPDLPPALVKAAIAKLAADQAKALENSTWVGSAFPARARAMHAGEEAQAVIHGQATLAEAKALVDDGVPVAPLPLPVTPPDKLN
jgi:hypothetical protein